MCVSLSVCVCVVESIALAWRVFYNVHVVVDSAASAALTADGSTTTATESATASSVLMRLAESLASSNSEVGDAHRFVVPDDGRWWSVGLKRTITAVMLSQPVPSPIVFDARQLLKSCLWAKWEPIKYTQKLYYITLFKCYFKEEY